MTQQSAELNAGGDLIAIAGTDLTLMASKISAGNEAYLHANNELNLLAAQDSNYSLYDTKKKGGWGREKTRRDEVTDVKNVGSEIKTGGDLTLSSGGDQLYQAARLNSSNDIAIDSGGAVTFEAVKDLHQESHEKSNNNAFWVSSKGKGNTDETVRQTLIIAEGNIVIKAVDGLNIDIKQIDQQTIGQSIDAMVKADPQLAWLKDAEKRGDVDWRQVKEIHDSFKYSNSGLGPASQIIIAIVMAAVVGPMAMGAMAGATGTAVAAGTMTASTAAGLSAAAGAVAAGAATNATVSAVNNRGNLGAVIKDVTSSDAMKGYVISGVTAGVTAGYFDDLTGTKTNTGTGKVNVPLNTWKGAGQFAANQALQSGTSLALSKALGQGGNVSDALKSALFNTLAAASFNAVGDYTQGVFADGSAPKVAIQAMVGGLLAEATGGDFKTGALAAGANEALVGHLNSLVKGDEALLTMSSQIVGVLAAAAQHDVDASKLEKGKWIAQNLTQYNFLNHLPPGLQESGSASITLAKDMVEKGFSNDQIAQAQLELARGQGFDGVQPATEFVKAWGMFMAGELTGASLAAALGRLVSGGAKATVQGPLVSKGADVTPEIIQKALQGDFAISGQNFVSLPAIQRYVDRLLKGDVAPPIKMDGNVIVDGNHRYIAAKILGRSPEVAPGTLSPSKAGQAKPVSDVKIDLVDWGNR